MNKKNQKLLDYIKSLEDKGYEAQTILEMVKRELEFGELSK